MAGLRTRTSSSASPTTGTGPGAVGSVATSARRSAVAGMLPVEPAATTGFAGGGWRVLLLGSRYGFDFWRNGLLTTTSESSNRSRAPKMTSLDSGRTTPSGTAARTMVVVVRSPEKYALSSR